jgi:hypothetical protein
MITPALEAQLVELARIAREQSVRSMRPDSAFQAQWDLVVNQLGDGIRSNEGYHLRQELQRARYRFIEDDPFSISVPASLRTRCLHEPARFAAFVEELLDPGELSLRHRLVASACSAGAQYEGRFNREIREKINGCLDADLAAFAEADELWGGPMFNPGRDV